MEGTLFSRSPAGRKRGAKLGKQLLQGQRRLNEALASLRKNLGSSLRKSKRQVSTRRFDTSDVIQESLIQIWSECSADDHAACESERPVHTERLETASYAWLRRIVLGHLAKQHRYHGAAKRSFRSEEKYPSSSLPGGDASPLSNCQSRELQQEFLVSLSRLTDVQRLVILRRIFEEESFSSIATELDCTLYFVRSEYKRAIKQLRADLLGVAIP